MDCCKSDNKYFYPEIVYMHFNDYYPSYLSSFPFYFLHHFSKNYWFIIDSGHESILESESAKEVRKITLVSGAKAEEVVFMLILLIYSIIVELIFCNFQCSAYRNHHVFSSFLFSLLSILLSSSSFFYSSHVSYSYSFPSSSFFFFFFFLRAGTVSTLRYCTSVSFLFPLLSQSLPS